MQDSQEKIIRNVFTDMEPFFSSFMNGKNIDEADQQDILQDFFLYLRDGAHPEKNEEPFSILKTIKKDEALPGWIKTTFSHFVYKWLNKENKASRIELQNNMEADSSTPFYYTEKDLLKAIKTFEYINENFTPTERFIFFSDIMALQQGHKSTKTIAEILKTNPNNVRVMRNRVMSKIKGRFDKIKSES